MDTNDYVNEAVKEISDESNQSVDVPSEGVHDCMNWLIVLCIL